MFTRTLVAALILATASVVLTPKVGSAETKGKPATTYHQSDADTWMERASRTVDGGGS